MAATGRPARVVGIGASAGGVDALTRLVRRLPADLPAAICIVLHVPPAGRSLLASILGRQTELDAVVAEHGAELVAGRIYVAPPDRHLTIVDGLLELGRGPKENGTRPAVDPMLRSLAADYGSEAVAVVLSGALGDGSSGALAVRRAGGTVIVQDPEDASSPSMPESAIRAVGRADAVLTAADIGVEIARLAAGGGAMRENLRMPRTGGPEAPPAQLAGGPPSALTCPECHGPLWELKDHDMVGYRCRVGHAFSEDALVVEQGSAVESALWSALEALEERADFLSRVATRHCDRRPRLRDRFESGAQDALDRAGLIRQALGARAGRQDAFDLDAELAE
jgi:two-component system, chemotaxis family, protein-glutamate methylesterase/glutaminase